MTTALSSHFSPKHLLEPLIEWGLRLLSYAVITIVGYILASIVWHGWSALTPTFLFDLPRQGGSAGGIFPAIIGTLSLVSLALLVAIPLGVGTAVYLSEYAEENRLTRYIRLSIATLAGVPSIVFGLFGLACFVLLFGFGSSILAGGLTLACMVLPTIIVASEEALQAVPKSFREGSLAVGATQWQTIWLNVLPYSFPGILTGIILSVGRAAGETAPILLTVAAFFLPLLPTSVFDQVMALPYHLFILATQHPDSGSLRTVQFGTALVLLLIVLGFNLVAIVLRNHFRKQYRWS